MAQQDHFENDTQTTVKYSTLTVGQKFLYNNSPYIKPDVDNKAVAYETGEVINLAGTVDVILPATTYLKFE